MIKSKKKLLSGAFLPATMVPFIGSGIKVLWAGGGISKSTAISSITGTLINIIGGGQATNIRNIVCFALGKAGNYNNWYDLAWTIIDLATVFCPGGMLPRLVASAGKLVATL